MAKTELSQLASIKLIEMRLVALRLMVRLMMRLIMRLIISLGKIKKLLSLNNRLSLKKR